MRSSRNNFKAQEWPIDWKRRSQGHSHSFILIMTKDSLTIFSKTFHLLYTYTRTYDNSWRFGNKQQLKSSVMDL